MAEQKESAGTVGDVVVGMFSSFCEKAQNRAKDTSWYVLLVKLYFIWEAAAFRRQERHLLNDHNRGWQVDPPAPEKYVKRMAGKYSHSADAEFVYQVFDLYRPRMPFSTPVGFSAIEAVMTTSVKWPPSSS